MKQCTNYAGVYFSVKEDGRQVDVTPKSITVDGLSISFASGCRSAVSADMILMSRFGAMYAQIDDENDLLMTLKPKLEAAFQKLGEALTPADDVVGKKDLRTGEALPVANRNVVYEYAFIEPKFELVTETIKHPTQIFFSCAMPLPWNKLAVGRVGNLQVRYTRRAREGWDDDTLSFNTPGWIRSGVDEMRVKFSDGEITAAFQELITKLLANDPTPAAALRWRANKAYKVELVK